MKKVTFMIKQEYEMPDHVKLVNVNDEIGECLFLHGMFLQPTLIFSKISNIDVENGYVASRLTD